MCIYNLSSISLPLLPFPSLSLTPASLTPTDTHPPDIYLQNHFTKPLPSTPKSVRVQGLSASCNLALETSSGARIAVNAAGGCTKLPANSGGDEGFVRVTADCDS